MATLVNLTPHTLNIITEGGTVTIPPSGKVVRVATAVTELPLVFFNGVEILLKETLFGEVEGLPEPAADTILIVSALVRAAAPEREDLFSPGDLVRDEKGNVIGCGSLTR